MMINRPMAACAASYQVPKPRIPPEMKKIGKNRRKEGKKAVTRVEEANGVCWVDDTGEKALNWAKGNKGRRKEEKKKERQAQESEERKSRKNQKNSLPPPGIMQ